MNWRDLILVSMVHDLGDEALPGQLIGPVLTTPPGVGSSLAHLEGAGLVTRRA